MDGAVRPLSMSIAWPLLMWRAGARVGAGRDFGELWRMMEAASRPITKAKQTKSNHGIPAIVRVGNGI